MKREKEKERVQNAFIRNSSSSLVITASAVCECNGTLHKGGIIKRAIPVAGDTELYHQNMNAEKYTFNKKSTEEQKTHRCKPIAKARNHVNEGT